MKAEFYKWASTGRRANPFQTGFRRRFRGLRTVLPAFVVLALGAPSAPVLAHYPWITVTEADAGPAFRVHFGHRFPGEGRLSPHQLQAVRLVEPDGGTQELVLDDREIHPLPSLGEGTYLLVVEQNLSFWSRTHEGGRRASREQYPDAFSCSQSANVMKAIVGRGGGAAWRQELGHPLELIPLSDPSALRTGDPLEVRVLLHGQPWAGEVRATYAGYEAQGEEAYALRAATNAEGLVRFVPAVAGQWLVLAQAGEAFPDPALCDRRSYHATLTFIVP
jgi:uncharacterized GH25 family protein